MLLNDLKHDLRHAWRLMRSRPTPALLAIGAIALSIGVSTAVFSIFNAVLVRELPYRDPGRLVMLWNTNDQAGMTLKRRAALFPWPSIATGRASAAASSA